MYEKLVKRLRYKAGWDETGVFNEAADAIEELSKVSEDVVQVVRCKYCRYWDRTRISCEGLARCLTGESGIRYRNANDFCSRADKEEDYDAV